VRWGGRSLVKATARSTPGLRTITAFAVIVRKSIWGKQGFNENLSQAEP